MFDHLLQENGDDLLQENGYYILLDSASGYYLYISDTSYAPRLDSFSFTEAANQGEVGIGGFNLDDDDLTMSVPALKFTQFNDFRASSPLIWSGFTHSRTTERGPMAVAGQRQWDVEIVDLNTHVDDFVLTAAMSADRPAETDYARITWLVGQLGTVAAIAAGVVPNTNTVTMDAVDYRGRKAREVLDQCAEITGKNWFLYRYTAGSVLLYYDLHTGTSLTTTSKISDVAADVDSSTVWAPIGPPTVVRQPDEIYSTVNLTWSGGVVSVTNSATASTYRQREINLLDMGVRTNTTATAKANAFLAASAAERTVVSDISLRLPAANVNDFRAGQRAQIKLTRHGISSYTYYRITRRTVRALPGNSGATDAEYLVTLSLVDTLAPTRYLYQRGSNEVWEVKSNATPDGASVIVNRDGITITNGGIYVSNSNGDVLIDGSSRMYRIVASGTLSVSLAAWSSGDLVQSIDTDTLSGLGTYSTPPGFLGWITNSLSVTAARYLHYWARLPARYYAASTSGGSPTTGMILYQHVGSVYTALDGSNYATANLLVVNASSSAGVDVWAAYNVLSETAI